MTNASDYPAFKMIKLRSKIKHCLLFSLVATALFVLYRTLAVDDVTAVTGPSAYAGPASPKSDISPGVSVDGRSPRTGPRMLEEVNDLMPITQPAEHLERMRQHEAQMMRNVRKIIQHRIRETTNRSSSSSSSVSRNGGGYSNGAVGSTNRVVAPPSLWGGLPNQPIETEQQQQQQQLQQQPHHQTVSVGDGPPVPLGKRFVHLDLKGAPPTLAYLAALFPFLSSLGATGLLLEYEDFFPYWGRLEDVRAYNSYSRDDVAEIQKLAARNRLEVVPLVQTFGHLEFVLKRGNFRGLREVPAYPQAICPSRNESLATLKEMLDQMLSLHPDSRYIHVGCDEVYNLGECPQCQERMERGQFGPETLFLQHVATVARHVAKNHGRRALIWDDMFRKQTVTVEAIRESGVAKYADLLVWKYGDTVEQDLLPDLWSKYSEAFPDGVWIASAFKGADYPASFATPVRARLDNQRAWAAAVRRYSHQGVHFKGIFLTGWQRFDHFATLCELLPAGLPSLAVGLAFLQHGRYDEEVERRVQQQLQCVRPVGLDLNVSSPDAQCVFPGADVYRLSLQFFALRQFLEENFFQSNYIVGWVNDYNIRTRFSSPSLLEQATYRYGDGVRNLSVFQAAMTEALSAVYDRYTVSEWLDSNVRPLLRRMESVMAAIKMLLAQSEWPRRPVTVSLDDDSDTNGVAGAGVGAAAVNQKVFQHATEP